MKFQAHFLAATMLISHPVSSVELTPELRRMICADTRAQTVPTTGQRWGCYDPLPGHPTRGERLALIAELTPRALAAEERYGVPAAALIAMALQESGAGFTRMPICSNNLYGFKYVSERAAGGRPPFVLECQPRWDKNNRYVSFRERADSLDFVAMKLGTLPAYRADAERYKGDIKSGEPRREAIRRWLIGIAQPYNYDPKRYVRAISRTLNDPIDPSDKVEPTTTLFNLYERWSELLDHPTTTGSARSEPIALSSSEQDAHKVAKPLFERMLRGRYMADSGGGKCTLHTASSTPEGSFTGWDSTEVHRCIYRVVDKVPSVDGQCTSRSRPGRLEKEGLVYLVLPSAERMTQWTILACQGRIGSALQQCVRTVAKWIGIQSQGQIAIAGTVWEAFRPDRNCDELAYLFKDGVAVRRSPDARLVTELSAEELIRRASPQLAVVPGGSRARPASTTPAQWIARYGGDLRQLQDGTNWSAQGRELIRKETIAGMASHENRLVSAWVHACVLPDGTRRRVGACGGK